MMTRCFCPICNTEYQKSVKECACGFKGIEYPIFENDKLFKEYQKKQLFNVYKFTKGVACGKINYEPSRISALDEENGLIIDAVLEKRGLAYVDFIDSQGRKTIAPDGMLALQTNIISLILNINEANADFLDEAHVQAVFFGKDFEKFTKGFFIPHPAIRYIIADEKNKNFSSENNVLFNKDKSELISYARCRPEEEYLVPRTVKRILPYSFFYTTSLKKLYLPKGLHIDDRAFIFYDENEPNIIYY